MSDKKDKLKDIKLKKRMLRLIKKDFNIAKSKHSPSQFVIKIICENNKTALRNRIRTMLVRN